MDPFTRHILSPTPTQYVSSLLLSAVFGLLTPVKISLKEKTLSAVIVPRKQLFTYLKTKLLARRVDDQDHPKVNSDLVNRSGLCVS